MRVFDRILDNALVLAAARIFQKLASFVLLWLLARGLTPEEFGLYSFVMVWVAFAGTITDLGTSSGAIRLWAQDAARMARAMPRLFAIRGGLVVAGTLVSIPLWLILYPNLPHWAFAWVAVGILVQVHSVAWVPFQAELANRAPAFWASLNRILVILLVAVALAAGAGVGGVLAVETIVPILFAAWLVQGAMKRAIARRTDSPAFTTRELFRDLLPIGVSTFLLMAYFRIDVFLLMHMKGERAVAEYAAGFRLVEPLLTFPGVLASSVMPVVVQRWTGGDRDGAMRAVGRFARLGPLALAMIALPLARHSEWLMVVLFGETYRVSGGVMSLLAWTLPLAAWAYAWHSLILADRRYAYNTTVASLALIGNVLGNLWAIPRWGIIGSAAMTIATEAWWALGVSGPALAREPIARSILVRTLAVAGIVAVAWSALAFAGGLSAILATLLLEVVLVAAAAALGLIQTDDIDGLKNAGRTRFAKGDAAR